MNQRKAGVALSYLTELVKIITGIAYTPIMLRLLGQSEYGLYQLVFSVVSYLGLLSMGFGSAYMRFYSQRKAKNDNEGIARLNGMFMSIFLFISFICIVCGVIMIYNITLIFGTGLTPNEYATARVLMVLMVIGLAITFPNSVFSCNLTAHEEFIFQKILGLAQSILNPFLSLPLLLMGKGSIGMVLVSTGLTLSCFIVNMFYSMKKLKMRFSFKKFDFSLLKEMWIFTFFIFLSQIIDQINWSVDKFLLGRIIGTGAVAIYGVGGQINSMYLQFSTSISNVFIPTVNRIVAEKKNTSELSMIFIKVGRIQLFIMSLILSGFILVGKPFINYWAGSGYTKAYYVTIFLIAPVTIPLIQNLGIEIQRAMNMHKSRSIVYLVISIMNIFISIPLIKWAGPIGAAIGTAVALFLGNVLFMNWYYHYRIKLDMVLFWKNVLKCMPSIIIPCLLGWGITLLFPINSVFKICVFGIMYTCIFSISVWLIGFNNYEKDLIHGVTKKVFKRHSK